MKIKKTTAYQRSKDLGGYDMKTDIEEKIHVALMDSIEPAIRESMKEWGEQSEQVFNSLDELVADLIRDDKDIRKAIKIAVVKSLDKMDITP